MCQNSGQQAVRLLVADSVRDWGGGERFVLDVARSMPSRGYEVTVLAYPESPLHVRCREEGFAVHTARTRANGAPWTVLPMVHWLRRLRPDLILTEYDKDLRTVALAARLARIDVRVVHSRECDGPVKDRPWIRTFHNRVADRILVASEATRVSTVESAPWLNPERVHVVPKGIDLTPFEHCLPLEDGPARFGFLGQLVRRKGVSELLEAFLGCDEEMTLSVAGDGPLRPSLEQLVRDRHASSRVRFEGFVRDVPAWLSTIDVLVLPSHAEGWGYVLAEAAAAGRLVLAFAASSVPEVTPASDGAELLDVVAHDRISSLERGIQQLARLEPSERRERGERLRNHARARLGLDRMLDDLDTFFRDTLSTPT